MTEEWMPYKKYKQHYADCKTVPGSYNKFSKMIKVLVPEGRKKPSGVRGQSYSYIWFEGTENNTGRRVRICIKAISIDHAIKRLPSDCVWNIE